MKNFRLVLKNMATIVVCFAVMTFAVSCGDDTPETTHHQTVEIEVANLPAGVTVAKLMVYDRDDESEYVEIASANLAAGKFTITLPPTLDLKYLLEAGSVFNEEYGYTVNNKSARIIEGPDMVRFDGFNEAGDHIGEFFYRNSTGTVGGYLGYADADVLITGRFESGNYVGSVFHLDFKTGWNWYYRNGEEDKTDVPAGVTLAWYFEVYAQ